MLFSPVIIAYFACYCLSIVIHVFFHIFCLRGGYWGILWGKNRGIKKPSDHNRSGGFKNGIGVNISKINGFHFIHSFNLILLVYMCV